MFSFSICVRCHSAHPSAVNATVVSLWPQPGVPGSPGAPSGGCGARGAPRLPQQLPPSSGWTSAREKSLLAEFVCPFCSVAQIPPCRHLCASSIAVKGGFLPLNWLEISTRCLKALAFTSQSQHLLGPAGGTKPRSVAVPGCSIAHLVGSSRRRHQEAPEDASNGSAGVRVVVWPWHLGCGDTGRQGDG